MKNIGIWIVAIIGISLSISCNNDPSLQKYFIDHQNDANFISLDLPASLIRTDAVNLNEEEKEALNSIHKVNLLLLPLKNEEMQNAYDKETNDISNILKSDTYETLIRFGSNDTKVVLKSLGEENIDEVVVFATDQSKGLALVRILGDNMKPEKMIKLARSVEQGRLDLGALKEIAEGISID
ncbi:DUF4252 domain-containing protein [Aquimarina sp. 2201CG1-2-11]|uniref:DUF4252 domain-containing protein n=1 Tax=Aquimarina discodermiae TaxID=3231043 RepID=UPI0034630C92